MTIPPLIVLRKFQRGEEAELFSRFMNNPYFPTHRRFIIRAFPELQNALRERRNEKKVVQDFVRSFYKKNRKNILTANVKSMKRMGSYGKKALLALGEIMEYEWEKKIRYYATPTILPFSPFKDDRFYFSILATITGKGDSDPLRTAIHEISHFIFFDILHKVERKEKILLGRDAMNYLKEGLTAVLLNKEPLRRMLRLDDYKGNPEIRELRIKPPRGKAMGFREYIDNVYTKSKEKHQPFAHAVKKLITIAHHHEPAFAKKRALWNQHDRNIFNDKKLLAQYQEPIKIKESEDT